MKIKPIPLKKILSEYNLRLSKGLGQNFLVDDNALQRVVLAANLTKESEVLEIGPGLGHLTRYLAVSSRFVHAVEIDKKIIPALESVIDIYDNVNLINADIMELELSELGLNDEYLVVANIPYYITSALIRKILSQNSKPKRLVLTVQKEVGERICAKEGDHSLLSLSVQIYGKPRISSIIKSSAFYPAPKVDSAIVRIDIHSNEIIEEAGIPLFFQLIKAGFSQKRKMLRNTISGGMKWSKDKTELILGNAGIDPKARPQMLAIRDWINLVKKVKESRN